MFQQSQYSSVNTEASIACEEHMYIIQNKDELRQMASCSITSVLNGIIGRAWPPVTVHSTVALFIASEQELVGNSRP